MIEQEQQQEQKQQKHYLNGENRYWMSTSTERVYLKTKKKYVCTVAKVGPPLGVGERASEDNNLTVICSTESNAW